MWCAIICDESQRFFRLLGAGWCRLVICGMCAVHLNDVHFRSYLRRFWSLQARWLEECALRWPPFHICVWFAASGLVGEVKRSRGLVWCGVADGKGLRSTGRSTRLECVTTMEGHKVSIPAWKYPVVDCAMARVSGQ